MSQIINWCEEHEESGGEACWYWEANKTWERPCHMVERIVVNPSDALIIRRDENGKWPREAILVATAVLCDNEHPDDVHPWHIEQSVQVLDALASSQGVEP